MLLLVSAAAAAAVGAAPLELLQLLVLRIRHQVTAKPGQANSAMFKTAPASP
jgi:hypothetical protein